MVPQLNILCAVDVVGALRAGSLGGMLFMMDNNPANVATTPGKAGGGPPSSGLGTDTLATGVRSNQVLNWHVLGIDVQTDIQIRGITFFQGGRPIAAADIPCAELRRYGAPSGEYWAGIVGPKATVKAGEYQYLIEFTMNGRRMTMDRYAKLVVSA